MSATRKITIEVPEALAVRLNAEIQAGGYASLDALMIENLGIHVLSSRYDGSDPEIEQWLREQVIPTLERRDREQTLEISGNQTLRSLKQTRKNHKSTQ